jgi:NAD(P)H-quinone oxidoreductase subunit 5
VLIAPLGFLVAAAVAATAKGVRPAGAIRSVRLASWVGLVVAAASCVAVAAGGAVRTPLLGAEGLGLAVRLDPLSVVIFTMISVLAVVILRFSVSYLDGDARQGLFLSRLARTIAAVQVLVLSANLATLVVAWVLTSLALHQLLVFHPERPRAVLAARKKFVAARLGDLLLVIAAVMLYRSVGTGDLDAIFDAATAGSIASLPLAVAAGCLVSAAMLKSAMFPTHGWLVEVMETPTPVSALLHAGVLNAGPYLVMLMAPVIAQVSGAGVALVLVGGATAALASMARITQPSVKVALGYSSAGHMGFSLMLCGLGLFPAAVLHLVAHSFYKAHAFLSSGSVIDEARASHVPTPQRLGSPVRLALGAAVAIAIYVPSAFVWGVRPDSEPALFVLGAVLVLATTQLVAAITDSNGPFVAWVGGAVLALSVTSLFFGFEAVMHTLLHDLVPAVDAGGAQLAAAGAVTIGFGLVLVQQLRAPSRSGSDRRLAWRIHLRNGLYANALFDRLVMWLWGPADRRRAPDTPPDRHTRTSPPALTTAARY